MMRREPTAHTAPQARTGAAPRAQPSRTTAARVSAHRSRRTARPRATRPGTRATARGDRSRPRHPSDFPALVALPPAHEDRAAARIEIGLDQRQRFLDPQPAAPQHDDQRAEPDPVPIGRILRITATISSTVGGSAGYTIPLLRGARPALWPGIAAGDRRRPVTSSSCGEDIAPSLREQIVDRPALPNHRPGREPSGGCRSPGIRQPDAAATTSLGLLNTGRLDLTAGGLGEEEWDGREIGPVIVVRGGSEGGPDSRVPVAERQRHGR